MSVSEKKVVTALRARDASALVAHLKSAPLSDSDQDKLVGILQRSGSLLPKYPDPNADAFRDELFERLIEFAELSAMPQLVAHLRSVEETLGLCQEGYRRILNVMPILPAYSLAPEVRVWALLRRTEGEFKHLTGVIQEKVASVGHIPSRVVIEDDSGRSRDADAATSGLVEILTMNLLMEAHQNAWFDPDGLVVLPPRSEVTDEDANAAAGALVLAGLWRRWQQTEERCRFLGGDLGVLEPFERPEGLPAQFSRVIRYQPHRGLEVVDFVSNSRLMDRIGQTYFDMLARTSISKKASGIEGNRSLPPADMVSAQEGHSAVLLCEWLSLDIASDIKRYAGLRLLEWNRGYSTLQCLSVARKAEGSLYVSYPRAELVSLLQRVGLAGPLADIFIDRASLRKGSPDLFDQPLVRCADGSLLCFVSAISAAIPARQVMSTLAGLGVQIDKKGKLFEEHILQLFKGEGLRATSFKAKRLGQEYEFDALVEWGCYVFLFECKNYSLSANRPQQTFHFGLSLRSHAKQTNRLATALRDHPDLLIQALGPQAAGKTIVPCVVNAMAYSFPEGIDGVFFTDNSALARFFQGRHLHEPTTAAIDGSGGRTPAVPLHSQWSGSAPTAEDLLVQLRDPIQFKLLAASIELRQDYFELDQSTLALTAELTRHAIEVPTSPPAITAPP